MEYQFRTAEQFHILVDEGVSIWISRLSTYMEVRLLDIQDDSNLGHP